MPRPRAKYFAELKARRHRVLQAIALHFGCQACGYDRVAAALDYHHVRRRKFSIAHAPGYRKELVIRELSKCVVLCANCHRSYHAGAPIEFDKKPLSVSTIRAIIEQSGAWPPTV